MSNAVEPPAHDERWDGELQPAADGDWEREFWVAFARDVHGIDADVLDERSTAWIVARVAEEPARFYGRSA